MLTKQIKDVIRRSVRAMGFELRRRTIQTSVDLQLEAILQAAKIDTVIDVGANEGQFATALRGSGYQGRIISFEPLSAAHARLVRASAVVLLKIDTEGYEDRVLAGARETLKSVRALQLEPSLVPLYDGQVLFLDMVRSLEAGGFQLHALIPEFTDPATGQTLQINGILMRRV